MSEISIKAPLFRRSDEELLRLLRDKPHAGMEAIVEQYTPILWKVAERYLENPEDRKECINDAFLELYIHQDRFNPQKGSLAVFLSQIVRNRSVSCYRKNVARQTVPLLECAQDSSSAAELAETRQDLDQALAALKPEDAQIIRMKYYEGMTAREIADKLGLSAETVKKRSQRSLSKMRMLLLGLLVAGLLALLAACAYTVLRWFGIIPGYGLTYSTRTNAFVLEEEVRLEDETGAIFLRDAMLLNDRMCFILEFYPSSPVAGDPLRDGAAVQKMWMDAYAGIPILLNGDVSCKALIGMARHGDSLIVTLHAEQIAEKLQRADVMEAAFSILGQDFTCRLVRAEVGQISDYSYQMGERGGLLAVPRLEEGRLIVGIYPLSTGEETLLPSLLRGEHMEGKAGDVTVTGPDGQELVGDMVYMTAWGGGDFRDWDFGPAQPGAYTLHIPYAYLTIPLETPVTFHLDLDAGTWTSQAQPVPGGTLSIESCQPLTLSMDERGFMGPFQAGEGVRFWNLRLRYTPETDLTLTACTISPSPEMEVGRKYLEETVTVGEDGTIYGVSESGLNFCVAASQAADNIVEQVITGWDGLYDPADVTFTISGSLSLRWEHSFDLPLLAER